MISGENTSIQPKSERIYSIDALRGLIIILMALDHANSFLSSGYSSEFWGGTLRQFESSAAFLVRFVTHICAPGFFFLMGISMIYLLESRLNQNWPIARIRRYFFTRGALIVFVHFALGIILSLPRLLSGNFGITFNVLFILGLSMMIGALLIRYSQLLLLSLAAICFVLPELVLGRFVQYAQTINPFFQLFIVPGPMGPHRVFYTLIPWLGFCIIGLVFGRMMHDNRPKAVARIPLLAAAGIALFIILRWTNGFGNIRSIEGDGWIAFLNVTKYPPSMTFALLMLSINISLLYIFEIAASMVKKHGQILLVFGRSALFFYVIHHFIYVAMMLVGFRNLPLPRMFIYWLIGLLIAYPLCQRYAAFKRRQPEESLWRLF